MTRWPVFVTVSVRVSRTGASWRGGNRRIGRRGPSQRMSKDDQSRAVAHQHLEPYLVDEVGDAVHDLRRPRRRRGRQLRPRSYVAPARAASNIASHINAIASGAFSFRPASRWRRAKLGSGEDEQPITFPVGQSHGGCQSRGNETPLQPDRCRSALDAESDAGPSWLHNAEEVVRNMELKIGLER